MPILRSSSFYLILFALMELKPLHAQQISYMLAPAESWHSLALTGNKGMVGATSYQNHWPSFNNAYLSRGISFETPSVSLSGAWGMWYNNESQANGISTLHQLLAGYVYKIDLPKKQSLNFGLRLGLRYFQLAPGASSTEEYEDLPKQTKTGLAASFGFAWVAPQYGASVSIYDPGEYFKHDNTNFYQAASVLYFYYTSAGKIERGDWIFRQQMQIVLSNSSLFRYTSVFNRSWAEFLVNIGNSYSKSSYNLGVGIGINYKYILVRYVFEQLINMKVDQAFNGHELDLLITFKNNKPKRNRYTFDSF
jgi:hypothetical protein